LPKLSLESPRRPAQIVTMSTKQIVQDLLEKLPENVSLHEVAREIEFVAAVRQGLAEIESGERIPIENIERELPSWVIQ
jgi:predicted transcriptional regulator